MTTDTDTTPEAEAPEAPLVTQAEDTTGENPFADQDGTAKVFDGITDPVDFGLLDSQIQEALGHPVMLALSIPDPDKPISTDNSATLYVQSEVDFDGRTVRGAITSHETPAVPDTTALDEALTTLRSGEDLDLAGVNLVLRSLV